MPKYSAVEIEEIAARRGFGGITVDTSIVIGLRNHLSNSAFHELRRLTGPWMQLIFPSVIKGEVVNHIARDAEEQSKRVQVAVERFHNYWILQKKVYWENLPETLQVDAADFAAWKWEDFLKSYNGVVLAEDDYIDIASLLVRYFDAVAPFETNAQKKNEFPDAMALLTLEAWAEQNNTLVLAISADKGWRDFCDNSKHLVCLDKMYALLNYFNKGADPYVKAFVEELRDGLHPKIDKDLNEAIQKEWNKLEFVPFEKGWSVDYENISATLLSWRYSDGPFLLSTDGERFMSGVGIKMKVEFEALFHYKNLLGETLKTTKNKVISEAESVAYIFYMREGDTFKLLNVDAVSAGSNPVDF